MYCLRRWVVVSCGLFCLPAQLNTECYARSEMTEVGIARVDITPDDPFRLTNSAVRTTESAGVAQRIWAKALAIGSDEQGPRLLVTVDKALGMGAVQVLPGLEFAASSTRETGGMPHQIYSFSVEPVRGNSPGSRPKIFDLSPPSCVGGGPIRANPRLSPATSLSGSSWTSS